MVKLGAVIALAVLAAFALIGFAPLFDCPHPEPHWCALLVKIKRTFARDDPLADPGPPFACGSCRDEGRVTLAKKLYRRNCCEVLTK